MNNTQQSLSGTYSHFEQKKNIGVSGLKILDGEDLTAGNRKRLQQLQQRDWIEQQVREKQERQQFLKETNKAYDEQTLHINSMAQSLEKSENQTRADILKAAKNQNIEQVFEKFDKNQADRQLDSKLSQQHVDYWVNNDFMQENTQTCQSQLAQHRVIPYHWKGMNETQKKDVLLGRDQQVQENQMIKTFQKEEDQLYAKQTEHTRFMMVNLDRERERQLKLVQQQNQSFNKLSAEEQKLKLKNQYGTD